jgi:hypothetical protein
MSEITNLRQLEENEPDLVRPTPPEPMTVEQVTALTPEELKVHQFLRNQYIDAKNLYEEQMKEKDAKSQTCGAVRKMLGTEHRETKIRFNSSGHIIDHFYQLWIQAKHSNLVQARIELNNIHLSKSASIEMLFNNIRNAIQKVNLCGGDVTQDEQVHCLIMS